MLGLMVLWPAFLPIALAAEAGTPESGTVAQGRWIYEANCAICHGVAGDGRGMAAHMFRTQPRDFSKGIFKFRSTPTGSIPTDHDLMRTITEGLRGTAMVPQPWLSERELRPLVAYLKNFSERFSQEAFPSPIVIPEAPEPDERLLAKGRELYVEAGCDSCHGSKGLGNGPAAGDLRDVWGHAVAPGNLTTPAKRGSSPAAIYQTLVTGLDGTPMPSYREALNDEQLWALAFHVASLNSGYLSSRQRQEELGGQHVLRMHGPRRGMMPHGPPGRMR